MGALLLAACTSVLGIKERRLRAGGAAGLEGDSATSMDGSMGTGSHPGSGGAAARDAGTGHGGAVSAGGTGGGAPTCVDAQTCTGPGVTAGVCHGANCKQCQAPPEAIDPDCRNAYGPTQQCCDAQGSCTACRCGPEGSACTFAATSTGNGVCVSGQCVECSHTSGTTTDPTCMASPGGANICCTAAHTCGPCAVGTCDAATEGRGCAASFGSGICLAGVCANCTVPGGNDARCAAAYGTGLGCCSVAKSCEPCGTSAGCKNNVKDGTETSVDCGGNQCAACAVGSTCVVPSDCLSGACPAGTCTGGTTTETCNLIDDNGDGVVDEGFTWTVSAWTDLAPAMPSGTLLRVGETADLGSIAVAATGSGTGQLFFLLVTDDGMKVSTTVTPVTSAGFGTATGLAVAADSTFAATIATSGSAQATTLQIDLGTRQGLPNGTSAISGTVIGMAPGAGGFVAFFADGTNLLSRVWNHDGTTGTPTAYAFPLSTGGRGGVVATSKSVFAIAESSATPPVFRAVNVDLTSLATADGYVAVPIPGHLASGRPLAVLSAASPTLLGLLVQGPPATLITFDSTFAVRPEKATVLGDPLDVVALGASPHVLSVAAGGMATVQRFGQDLQPVPAQPRVDLPQPLAATDVLALARTKQHLVVFRLSGPILRAVTIGCPP